MADVWRNDWSDVHASFARMGVADGFAIHHTASLPLGLHYDPAYLRRLEWGEINAGAGYHALAYHTMGFMDGFTAESRPYGAQGAATGGHNGHTIALCAIGYFHRPYHHQPTEELINAFAREIYACRQLGFATPHAIVRPHTWWTAGTRWATSCCGEEFIPFVEEIERRSYNPVTPPAPEPPRPKGAHKMIVAMINFAGKVAAYLIGDDGLVIMEFKDQPNESGIPKDAASAIEKMPHFWMNGEQWTSVLYDGRLPKFAVLPRP